MKEESKKKINNTFSISSRDNTPRFGINEKIEFGDNIQIHSNKHAIEVYVFNNN